MESFQEDHINNPFFYGDFMSFDCLTREEAENELDHLASPDNNGSLSVYSPQHHIPFLHMLQDKLPEPSSFQLLLRLQEEQLRLQRSKDENDNKALAPTPPPPHLELESCVTHVAERKKRKRTRTVKKAEEAESQRMSHIAVERNRRRLMNGHLSSLRSLMPPSYVLRGDQASIVGGAIDYVKELEQHLQALQAEKRTRAVGLESCGGGSPVDGTFEGFFTTPQYTRGEGFGGGVADVEASLVQTHVNVRVLVGRRGWQLVRVIGALEELHLVVLHLNVTSVLDSVLYSLNLKMEEDCKLGSAEEIATAVHQIFSHITTTC